MKHVQENYAEYKNICKEHPLKEGENYTEVIPSKDEKRPWANKDLMIVQTENGPMVRITESLGDRRFYIGNLSFTNEKGEKQTLFVHLDQFIFVEDHEDMGLYPGNSWALIDGMYVQIKEYDAVLFRHLDTKFKQSVGELKNTNKEVYDEIYEHVSQPEGKL